VEGTSLSFSTLKLGLIYSNPFIRPSLCYLEQVLQDHLFTPSRCSQPQTCETASLVVLRPKPPNSLWVAYPTCSLHDLDVCHHKYLITRSPSSPAPLLDMVNLHLWLGQHGLLFHYACTCRYSHVLATYDRSSSFSCPSVQAQCSPFIASNLQVQTHMTFTFDVDTIFVIHICTT
jgi:hypothetical protein